jgi:hypothetical protein
MSFESFPANNDRSSSGDNRLRELEREYIQNPDNEDFAIRYAGECLRSGKLNLVEQIFTTHSIPQKKLLKREELPSVEWLPLMRTYNKKVIIESDSLDQAHLQELIDLSPEIGIHVSLSAEEFTIINEYDSKLLERIESIKFSDIDNEFLKKYGHHPLLTQGKLDLTGTKITSLEGLPDTINGGLSVGFTQITTLEGLPHTINGDLDISENQITSLQGLPPTINGNLDIGHTQITSLEELPPTIHGGISLLATQITSLKGLPPTINGNLDISRTQITNLEGLPGTIRGNLSIRRTQITSLDGTSAEIHGDLMLSRKMDIPDTVIVHGKIWFYD